MIKLRVKEGPNARDQIAFYAHHSSLVEVQTNAGYNLDPRALLHMTAMEGCTGFEDDARYTLARMYNGNLEIRILGCTALSTFDMEKRGNMYSISNTFRQTKQSKTAN